MSKAITAAMIAASALVLGGCGQKTEGPKAPLLTINDAMTKVMEPNAQTIWDTVSKAYNDVGDGLVDIKLTDADWTKIAKASRAVKDRAQQIADGDHIVVAAPNEPILGAQAVGVKGKIGPEWDAASVQQIQAKINANPKLFSEKARALVDSMDAIGRAASSRDVLALYKATSNVDEVCDGCHEPFWGTDEPPPAPK